MNQSILFNDDLTWDEQRASVRVTAQLSGALVNCFITIAYLQRLGLKEQEPQQIIAFCELCLFDIEEDAALLIEDEHLTENNELHLV